MGTAAKETTHLLEGQPPSPEDPIEDYGYNTQPREHKNLGFKYLWFSSLAAVIGVGIYGVQHRHRKYADMSPSYLVDASHCPASGGGSGRRLLGEGQAEDFDFPAFMHHAVWYLAISAAGAAVTGLVLLRLFQANAKAMVRLTVAVQIVVPAVIGVSLLQRSAGGAGAFFLYSALAALCFWAWQDKFELTANLLTVSATGLRENPGILGAVVAINLGLAVLALPMLALTFVAFLNGDIAPNPEVAKVAADSTCSTADGDSVACCVWDLDDWVYPYVAFTTLVLAWTARLAFEIRIFTVAGSVSQWYFSPVGSSQFKGTTMRSLGHAAGPQLGSLCFGALILTAVDFARSLMRRNRQGSNSRGIMVLLECLVVMVFSCVMALVEFVTKFATVQAAMSGEDFCGAARTAFDLLKRNFVDAYATWWFPGMVLNMCSFMLAAAWGMAVGLLSYTSFAAQSMSQPAAPAVILGLISLVLAVVVLAFFSNVLLNIVDVVFFCYAMDKDRQMVTRPDVHEVCEQLPVAKQAGFAVEQPDGDISYAPPPELPAAPTAPQQV